MKSKIPKCPQCVSQRVAAILYGMPAFEKIEKDLRAGRIVLGGCVVTDNDPQWRCLDCMYEFGQIKR